jgi:hypothetical protein
MHFLSLLSLATAATAKVLVKYDADANDDLSRFGQVNYDCWSSNDCGTANFDAVNGNASLHFRVRKPFEPLCNLFLTLSYRQAMMTKVSAPRRW